MDKPDDTFPNDPRNLRRPWTEGPDEDAPGESWLSLGDDELLHRVETLDPGLEADDRLLEVVQSERHFFIRQEAAKRVRDRTLLFAFENDRHIGQILVRSLTRREDVTYLERLVAQSCHSEVRAAAQVQIAHLWGRLGGPTRGKGEGEESPPPPEFERPAAPAPPPPPDDEEIEIEVESMDPVPGTGPAAPVGAAPAAEPATSVEPGGGLEPAPTGPAQPAAPASPASIGPGARSAGARPGSAGDASGGVDGSLLGWAVHFLVEQVWPHLDTRAARGVLLRTHAELLPFHPALSLFRVEDDAHVHVDLTGGTRLPREAVCGVAAWMTAFLAATRSSVADLGEIDVRQSTRMMADALEQVGFYDAFRAIDEA